MRPSPPVFPGAGWAVAMAAFAGVGCSCRPLGLLRTTPPGGAVAVAGRDGGAARVCRVSPGAGAGHGRPAVGTRRLSGEPPLPAARARRSVVGMAAATAGGVGSPGGVLPPQPPPPFHLADIPSAMADIGRQAPKIGGPKGPALDDGGKSSGGGVAVITKQKTGTKQSTQRKEKTDKEKVWRVLLHNDDVHTFEYVTQSIVKVVKTVTRKKAHRITMQAHSSGMATVTSTWKAQAEDYSKGLQVHGLTSSIAPDSSFQSG